MSGSQHSPVTFATVREMALSFPGVEEGTSHGTPSLHVGKKHIGWLREDDETLVIGMDDIERDMLLQAEPEIYYMTDHYIGSPYVLIPLSKIARDDLRRHIEQAWRRIAPKRRIADFEAGSQP